MNEVLTSMKNPRIQLWRSLSERKGRLDSGSFLVEGDKMVQEALASRFDLREILLREDRPAPAWLPDGVPVYVLSPHAFDAISSQRTPQGIAAVLAMHAIPPAAGPRLLALDGVQDPGNVGTILRTADAAGFSGALLSPACADVFSPKTLRATMGSVFRLGLSFPASLPDALLLLKNQGYALLSSQLDGEPFYSRSPVTPPLVLIIGSEGNGVSEEIKALATHRLRLPMRGGAESLNAAVAAGIMMYDLIREAGD